MSVRLEKFGALFEDASVITWLQSESCLGVRNVIGLFFLKRLLVSFFSL